ncbi:MAG: RsmE family RNA methyltransferase [Phycisphaerae bacterium]
MRERRFRVEAVTGETIAVAGAEARHALRVLRLGIGDRVVLFDGDGREVTGNIRSVSQGRFEVERIGPIRVPGRSRATLTLAAAAPKGARADWLVEKCAELGVQALWFLITDRGAVIPGDGKLARWRRKASEAAKQAGHARIMAIKEPACIDTVFDAFAGVARTFYGNPEADSESLIDAMMQAASADRGAESHDLILVGPEGGFTKEETKAIERRGGKPVRLGAATLRVETAAVAAAAIWSCVAGAAR